MIEREEGRPIKEKGRDVLGKGESEMQAYCRCPNFF
jgi:hypothetical protein